MPRTSDFVSGGELFAFPGYTSGQRFTSGLKGIATQDGVLFGSSLLILCPFIMKQAATLDRLGVFETGSNPGGEQKLAFYDSNRSLIATVGSVTTVQGSGLREVAINQVLGKGLNYLAIKTPSSWGINCRCHGNVLFEFAELFSIVPGGVVNAAIHAPATPFPATAPAMTETTTGIPLAYMRVA